MVTFTPSDFQIYTPYQKEKVRDKLDYLGKSLSQYAQEACPGREWDHYVTGRSDYGNQWAAIYPIKPIDGNRDLIVMYPCIYFNVPQDGSSVTVAANIEFKIPREMLMMHCTESNANNFLQILQRAHQAKICILKKEVLQHDRRVYNWSDLWDSKNLPQIDVSKCTSTYLNRYAKLVNIPPKHPHQEWLWESVFLVKYEFAIHKIVHNKNIDQLLGNKVTLLAPIIEYLAWG